MLLFFEMKSILLDFFFSCRSLLRLIICKMLVLTYKSKGLTKKPLQLLGQHSNWMVHIQQRLFYAYMIYLVVVCLICCHYRTIKSIKLTFLLLCLELSSNNSGKLASI